MNTTKRPTKCPNCKTGTVVQCRYTGDYCEDCGWPDENRPEHSSGLTGEHDVVLDAIEEATFHNEP